jgi:hypothetical protein
VTDSQPADLFGLIPHSGAIAVPRGIRLRPVMKSTDLLPPDHEPDYWAETQRPLVSLAFLLPLLIGYEAAVVAHSGGEATGLRNGADAWMRGWLLNAGVQFPWVLPIGVAAGLLGWHLIRKDPWCVRFHTVLGMLAESLLFALLLIICGQTLHMAFGPGAPAEAVTASLSPAQVRMVSYLGAGLYEESLFRLLLLPGLYGLGRLLRQGRMTSGIIAVVLSSAIFAIAHYLPVNASALSPDAYATAIRAVHNDPDLWYGFVFRAMAGLAFGTLFLLRGFGVTVGSHAAYDILVGFMASVTV